jgi:hypothetical protein
VLPVLLLVLVQVLLPEREQGLLRVRGLLQVRGPLLVLLFRPVLPLQRHMLFH